MGASLLEGCASSGILLARWLTCSMNIPKAVPKMWKADEMMYQTLRGAKLTAQMDSKMIRSTLNRMRCIEVSFILFDVMPR